MSDIPADRDLLDVLARIIVPRTRDAALQLLLERGLLDAGSHYRFTKAFSSSHYTDRNQAVITASAKAIIDEYAFRGTRYSFLNGDVLCERLRERLSFIPDFNVSGKDIVDYGAGTHSTYSTAALLLANGARSVRLIEPGKIKRSVAIPSLLAIVHSLLSRPDSFIFGSPSERPDVVSAINRMDLPALVETGSSAGFPWFPMFGASDIGPNGVDLILSTSVLEHVGDVHGEAKLQFGALRPGGYALHMIDFTDHRRAGHNFQFYFDGEMKRCNGLRKSDMENAFKSAGFTIRWERVGRDAVPAPRDKIIDRFRHYSDDDLLTHGATLVALKP